MYGSYNRATESERGEVDRKVEDSLRKQREGRYPPTGEEMDRSELRDHYAGHEDCDD